MTEKKLPVNLSISFHFDRPIKPDKMTFEPSGDIHVFYEGERIHPIHAFRIVSRERPNKPKIYSIMPIDPQNLNVKGLVGAVTQYDAVYAIDCNAGEIDNEKIYVACFIVAGFQTLPDRTVQVDNDKSFRILEFRNIEGKHENVAWKNLIEGINRDQKNHSKKIGVIVDSDLSNIEAYNRREKPIVGSFYLPANIDLIYATTDTATELVNKLLGLADREARRFIKNLKEGSFSPDSALEIHPGEPYTGFRFWLMNGEWGFKKNILKGLTIPEGTEINLFGRNSTL